MRRPERHDYDRKCRETLALAFGEVPLYQRWRAADPGDGHHIDERYAALPVLSKSDIRAHFPHGLLPRGLDLDAALRSGEVSFVSTSGTADEALTNIWNQSWWNASERASWALNAVAARVATGAHREAILASALSVGPRSTGQPLDRAARTLGRFVFLNEHGLSTEWPVGHEARILTELGEIAPVVLEANPSLLARVARYAAREGLRPFQPELVTLTYEYPSELQLRAIRAVFDGPIASSYGSTEAGYVLMECEHGRLHQNSEFCRIDLLPLDGSPLVVAREGAAKPALPLGRLAVTTFGNRWFPLLRFDIGDVGRLAEEPCPCGRSFGLVLSAIEGRNKSLCLGADGRLLTHRELDHALAAIDGLCDYQLVQHTPQSVELSVVADDGQGPRVAANAHDVLRRLFGSTASLGVHQAAILAPEPSGKRLLVKRGFPFDWEVDRPPGALAATRPLNEERHA